MCALPASDSCVIRCAVVSFCQLIATVYTTGYKFVMVCISVKLRENYQFVLLISIYQTFFPKATPTLFK